MSPASPNRVSRSKRVLRIQSSSKVLLIFVDQLALHKRRDQNGIHRSTNRLGGVCYCAAKGKPRDKPWPMLLKHKLLLSFGNISSGG